MSIGIVLATGGRGLRMGGSTPKQFLEISGKPIYLHSLETFLLHPEVSEIRIGMPEDYVSKTTDEIAALWPAEIRSGRLRVFTGGVRRQDTVERGVRLLGESSRGISGVLVHDAARPFLSDEILGRAISAVSEGRAVGVGVPVSDTLWKVEGGSGPQRVFRIVPRESMISAQTPQGAPLDLFLRVLDRARTECQEFTDEASLFLWAGIPFYLVEGSNRNRKITRPEDMVR